MRSWRSRLFWLAAIVTIAGAFAACSSPFASSTTGQVVVNFGSGSGAASRAAGIPVAVSSIEISIKASDMTPVLVKLTTPSLSATIDVPAGADRSFEVLAKDSADIPIYRGKTDLDIQAGTVHELSVTMAVLYALSYDANGADSGTVPLTLYREAGTALTIAPNSGGLVKTGFAFNGWNTQADGLGTDYLAGAALTMPASAFTLYAKWGLPSNNANLAIGGLVVSGVILAPGFDPAIVSYAANANSSVPTITVTPTKAEAGGSIQVRINAGGYTLTPSGSSTGALALDAPLGSNTIDVLVTAADTVTTKTYTVTIAKTVMVTITPGIGGNVAPGSGEFTPGAIVPLIATPNPGYRFVDWTGTATVIPPNVASSNLTVPAISPSFTTANFAPFNGGDGTPGTPYEIANLDQLKLVNSHRSSYFILTANINLSIEPNWLPIGDATTKFTGGFNGNGFVLDNLTINTAVDADRGLFGYVDGAVITNVSLTNINFIDTFNYAGGLIGTTMGATQVTNCSVTGSIAAYQYAGGLIGQCVAGSTLVVSKSWASVSINTDAYGSIGGLIGYSLGGSISKSHAIGAISETSAFVLDHVGGLVGYGMNTTITDSYAQVSVTGTNNVGGLVGYNDTSDITNCYSTGSVTCPGSNPGGLIGYNTVSAITSSYYDTSTSGQSDNMGKGVPLTTAVMQSDASHAATYVGWDFVAIWNVFTDGTYPTLRP